MADRGRETGIEGEGGGGMYMYTVYNMMYEK